MVAFKGLNVILGPYKCNYSLPRGKELGPAASEKQGAGLDKTRWRAESRPTGLVFATCAVDDRAEAQSRWS